MVPIDVAKLDEEIRKLQELRRLASDPSLARFFVSTNGHNGQSEAGVLLSGNETVQATGVQGAVEQVCRQMSGEFTIREVLAGMNARGFDFRESNPQRAVGNALRRLSDKERIKIVHPSSGRQPIVYVNS